MTKQIKHPKLSKKHNNFIAGVVEGKSFTQSYADQYPNATRDTARINSSRLMQKPEIQTAFIDILNSINLNDTNIANQLNDITKADTQLSFQGRLTGDSVPNYKIRLDALNTILKLRGHLQTQNQTNIQVNTQVNESMPVGLTDHLEQLNNNLVSMRSDLKSNGNKELDVEFEVNE